MRSQQPLGRLRAAPATWRASDLVTWCVGHLVELDAPEAYNPAWKQWAWQTCRSAQRHLPIIPPRPTRDQFNVITQLLERADVTTVVNAADAGGVI